MIRAIAFDWGGVFTRGTFDSGAIEALARRYDEPEAVVAARYYPLMAEFEVGAFDLLAFHRRFEADRTPRSADTRLSEAEFRATFLGSVRWRTSMLGLLASIPPTYTVGMLSNNTPSLCDVVRDDPRLKRVERFVFSNEIAVRKPDAAAFAALTDALGVPPRETVFVDDNEENVRACAALGFAGLLIDQPTAFAQRWEAALPDLPVRPILLAPGATW